MICDSTLGLPALELNCRTIAVIGSTNVFVLQRHHRPHGRTTDSASHGHSRIKIYAMDTLKYLGAIASATDLIMANSDANPFVIETAPRHLKSVGSNAVSDANNDVKILILAGCDGRSTSLQKRVRNVREYFLQS